ncbi:hypothetical protein C4K37_3563 [Pseudomonas chlororaphis subsp. piscium]|nr:hypothetical protein C4K37_3563 [Pseudomonas chlororaphis subsp. piscium]AZC44496.1 hypothetical protein C4K36_3572 [Pseudomonas chlororaphis subsp. piscium]AZC51150.1 hypothetical protein C4K35_3568 [Pseudomonas chlororaphis subsp. piscium]AZC96238.1 hypothetical protein C4K28_3511 [Pseudomonas chlororaphis subsp. piscium]
MANIFDFACRLGTNISELERSDFFGKGQVAFEASLLRRTISRLSHLLRNIA